MEERAETSLNLPERGLWLFEGGGRKKMSITNLGTEGLTSDGSRPVTSRLGNELREGRKG